MTRRSIELLVTGAQRVDAGKTTFSVGLLEHIDAVGFKPRAGNDYWFSHDDVQEVIEDGRLFGADAKRLAATSIGQFDPEAINPIHRLWRPSPGRGSGILGQDDREFVLDRVGDDYVLNATANTPAVIREAFPLDDALRVETLDEFNRVMEQLHVPTLREMHETVSATERAVVESYGNVARPLQAIEPDAVAVVEPHRVRLYDGDRYVRACEVATRSPREGQLEERVESVVDLIDPATALHLPALDETTRGDAGAVAEAYGHAYEQLLEVARAGTVVEP